MYGGVWLKIQFIECECDFYEYICVVLILGLDGLGKFFGVIKFICLFQGLNMDMVKMFFDQFIFQLEYYECYINIQNVLLYLKQKEEIDMCEKFLDFYIDVDIEVWKLVIDVILLVYEMSLLNLYVDFIFMIWLGLIVILFVISEDMDLGKVVD